MTLKPPFVLRKQIDSSAQPFFSRRFRQMKMSTRMPFRSCLARKKSATRSRRTTKSPFSFFRRANEPMSFGESRFKSPKPATRFRVTLNTRARVVPGFESATLARHRCSPENPLTGTLHQSRCPLLDSTLSKREKICQRGFKSVEQNNFSKTEQMLRQNWKSSK